MNKQALTFAGNHLTRRDEQLQDRKWKLSLFNRKERAEGVNGELIESVYSNEGICIE